MNDRAVLLFAYHFLPENAIGAVRPARFYKYLSRLGYRCRVITAARHDDPPNPEIECVPDPFITKPRGAGWQFERALRKFLLPGVTGTQWAFRASKTARTLLSESAVPEWTIVSTSPPLGVHLAAWLLARRLRTKWIADLRDPIADNPGSGNLSALHKRCFRLIESAVIRAADIVIANTEEAAEELRGRYPAQKGKIKVIWNGYDPEERMNPQEIPPRPYRLFSHVGDLYEGRTATPLLQSFARLIKQGKINASSLKIYLVGDARASSLPDGVFLDEAKTIGWLEITAKSLPKEQAKQIAMTSDGLLLIQPHSTVQVPGKLFEYLQVGRPILAFIMRNSPIERILRHSGIASCYAYADSPPEVLDSAVENFFGLPSQSAPLSQWCEEQFNVEKQVETLHELIKSIHPR